MPAVSAPADTIPDVSERTLTPSQHAPESPRSTAPGADLKEIVIRGAREHNLKDVDLTIPRNSMVVFTGLSGSGKSSLAFDTIFAEGQRRYVESLSSYARMFLGRVDKPDVDFIEGLSPAVSIDQKSTSRNPRSTVGTITEIYDYMRLLWARVGHPHCPQCGEPITRQTPQQIVDRVMQLPERTRFQVLAPVVRRRKGEFEDLLSSLTTSGYSRAVIDGEQISLDDPPKLKKQIKHDIEVVVDRLVIKEGAERRLTDSVETALGLADGRVVIEIVTREGEELPEGVERRHTFSEHLACPNDHPIGAAEIEPRSFSFNAPFGACPECDGIGSRLEADETLVVPDEDLTLVEGAIQPWSQGKAHSDYWNRLMAGLGEEMGFDLVTPWKDLPKANPSSEDERVVQVSRLYPLQIPASDACPTVGTPKNKVGYRDLSRKIIDCQFAAWNPQFEQAGMTLSKPTLIIFNKTVSTACGKASAEQSFYCPATEEIYLSEQRFESSEQWWRLHFANTLVHEFVHHVQHRAGILDASMGLAQGSQERTRRVELQAYCVANRVTLMTPGFKFGQRDYATLKQWAEQGEESKTHGSRASRQHWWMRGLEQSTVGGCNTWVVPAGQVT